jgi:uncharacterized protein YgiM (DUF1202 family)
MDWDKNVKDTQNKEAFFKRDEKTSNGQIRRTCTGKEERLTVTLPAQDDGVILDS